MEHILTFVTGAGVALFSVMLGYALRLYCEHGDNGDEDAPPPQPQPYNEGRFSRLDGAHLN